MGKKHGSAIQKRETTRIIYLTPKCRGVDERKQLFRFGRNSYNIPASMLNGHSGEFFEFTVSAINSVRAAVVCSNGNLASLPPGPLRAIGAEPNAAIMVKLDKKDMVTALLTVARCQKKGG